MLVGGAQVGLRVLTVISGILLARLLDPADFGAVTLAYVVISTAGLFMGLGLGPAVIASRGDRGAAAYQAFVLTVGSGLVFFALLEAGADLFAGLLRSPGLVPVLQWLSVTVLTASLAIVPEALLQKELLFGRVSLVAVVVELVNIGVSLALAAAGFGVWSLVYAALVRSVVNVALLWALVPGRPWLHPRPWNGALARSMLGFGLNTAAGGVTTFVYQTVDNVIVGRQLGEAAVGIYGKAMDFTTRTVDGFNNVISVVLFPSYAQIRDDRDRLARAFLKTLRVVSFVTVPAAMGILVTAPEMVRVLLGEKWLAMIPPLQIFAGVSLIKPLSASTSALFSSVGRPGYNMRAGVLIILILLPGIVALLPYGVPGVALAVLLAHIAGFVLNIYQVSLVIPGAALRMLPAIAPAFAISCAMGLAVAAAKGPLAGLTGGEFSVASLALLLAVGVAVYVPLLALLQRPLVTEILHLAAGRGQSGGDGGGGGATQ